MEQKSFVNETFVKQLLYQIDGGLTHGMGGGGRSNMCVQHAVNHVMGRGRSDDVTWCALNEINSFGIHLNDCRWTSKRARADGLRRLAVAELGSNKVNKAELAQSIRRKYVNHMLPQQLEIVGKHELAAHARSANTDLEHHIVLNKALSESYDAHACGVIARMHNVDSLGETLTELSRLAASMNSGEPSERHDCMMGLAVDIVAEALRECGSEGGEYLHLADVVDEMKAEAAGIPLAQYKADKAAKAAPFDWKNKQASAWKPKKAKKT